MNSRGKEERERWIDRSCCVLFSPPNPILNSWNELSLPLLLFPATFRSLGRTGEVWRRILRLGYFMCRRKGGNNSTQPRSKFAPSPRRVGYAEREEEAPGRKRRRVKDQWHFRGNFGISRSERNKGRGRGEGERKTKYEFLHSP